MASGLPPEGSSTRGTVVCLDLAARAYADNGLVVLRPASDGIDCEIVSLAKALPGKPEAGALAGYLDELASGAGAGLILVDGPQAWKAADSGLVQRRCEKLLATPGKTGEPGTVLPRNWTRFAALSIALFDELGARGWSRLERADPAPDARRRVAECFPTAAWRRLGLDPLPSKRRCLQGDVARGLARLAGVLPLRASRPPSHDELQALVAGLGGVAMQLGYTHYFEAVGSPPLLAEGSWREGYIVCPRLPAGIRRVRFLGAT